MGMSQNWKNSLFDGRNDSQILAKLEKNFFDNLNKNSKKFKNNDELYESDDKLTYENSGYSLRLNDVELDLKPQGQLKTIWKINKNCWKNNIYKNIIFNPNASNEIFYAHLMKVYEGLIYVKKHLKKPKFESIQKKSLNLHLSGDFFFFQKIIIFGF